MSTVRYKYGDTPHSYDDITVDSIVSTVLYNVPSVIRPALYTSKDLQQMAADHFSASSIAISVR